MSQEPNLQARSRRRALPPRSWAITIDRLPESMNKRERSSFWVRKRELAEITEDIARASMMVPIARGRRRVAVTIHKGMRSRVTDDPANRDSRAKSVLDAMVKLGLLVDDSDHWLDWAGVREGEKRATKQTVIEIWECAS